MKTNVKKDDGPKTVTGSPAKRISKEQELRRSVMACLLWEDQFYESGVSIAKRIRDLVVSVDPQIVSQIAIEAREEQYLRHAPLMLVRELARHPEIRGSGIVRETLARVIQRADELTEFMSLYWKDGKCPIAAQVKEGLAKAFTKFSPYQLAKYDSDGQVKLRDVLFLCHGKPKDSEQDLTWKKLIDGSLDSPDTWEVNLSAGKDKKETWERLLKEKKLGGLALLRNLRNFESVKVDTRLVTQAIDEHSFDKVLPFRFIAASLAAPRYEEAIDRAFLRSLGQGHKLPGKTVVVIDVSGSMYGSKVSKKSDMDRAYAACALGAITREACEEVAIYATAGDDWTRIHKTELVPPRRGMALVQAIHDMSRPLGGGGIFLTPVCRYLHDKEGSVDRMIVITDEADCAGHGKDAPTHANPIGKHNYLLNVASYKNGIGYGGKWVHIDGWSEACIKFISELERHGLQQTNSLQ